jgi:hypothetical protein
LIAAILLAAAAAAPPPTYVVERLITVGDETRRVSVFRNGMAVLARNRAAEAGRVLRNKLSPVEMQVVSQVVAECYPEVARYASTGPAPGAGTVELRLAPPGRDPLIVTIDLAAAQTVGVARLMHALDQLEARLGRERVTREDLSDWRPAVGERLELDDGRVVTVVELVGSGDRPVVRVEIGDGPATEYMTEDELRREAVRRLAP